jgi:hypothetical protein
MRVVPAPPEHRDGCAARSHLSSVSAAWRAIAASQVVVVCRGTGGFRGL